MSQNLKNIEKLVKDKYTSLSENDHNLMLLHVENALSSENNLLGVSLGGGIISSWTDGLTCFACKTAIITIVSPLLVSSLPAYLVKKGLLGLVDKIAEASGSSTKKVTDVILSCDAFALVNNGAGWFAEKLCPC